MNAINPPSSEARGSWPAFDAEAQQLADALRARRLTALVGASGLERTAMLASVLPLLRRRVDDHPPRPEVRRMGAPVRDRRRAARGSNQSEIVFTFDQWRNSRLASLNRLLDESHAIAVAQSARILFVFDHFEQLLESPKNDANAQQFVERWVRVLQEPGLHANFLVVLDERAWTRLKKLGERIPRFDEMRAFELQARSARQALDPVRAAGGERQAEVGTERGVVDFDASLRAKLSEVATLARPDRAVLDDFQASVDAALLEVRRSARREAAASLTRAPGTTARGDLRSAGAFEAFKKAGAVHAAEAQRFAQAQRAAEAEAAREVEATRAADAEAKRIAQEAAAAEDKRIAEELRRVEAERAAEAEAARAAEAQRAADAEAKRVAQEAAAAEARRIAEAQRVAQARRAAEAEAARAAEAQRAADAEAERIAQEAAAAEAKRIAEELRRVEAERAAEVQRVAQIQRAAEAEAARSAQAQRAADVEAKRVAEAAAADEARTIAEAADDAAAAAKAKGNAETVELATEASRGSEAQVSAQYTSAPIASPSIAAAKPGTPVPSAIKWGGATLAAILVAALLWPSHRQRPDAPDASSPEAPTSISSTQPPPTAPAVAAPDAAPEVAPVPIQPAAQTASAPVPYAAAETASAPPVPYAAAETASAPPVPNAAAQTASAPPAAVSGAPTGTSEPGPFTVWMNAGGSDARIAGELARAIGGGAASARAVKTAAGVDPVESLRAPRSLAIARYAALRAARRSASAPPLRVLAPLYAEEVVFIVRADSPLKFIHDLRGRRVNIGSPREGSSQTAREIYRQMFGTAMANPSQLGKDAALAELVGFRSIDAMVLVEAQPSAWLASLHPNTARGLRLLRLDRQRPEDRRVLQEFQTSVLRAGPGLSKGESIPTLATMTYLAVSGTDDADAKPLTDMVLALCRELPRLRAAGHPKWRELQPWVNQDTGWPVVAAGKSALKNCVSSRPAPAPAARRAAKSHSKH